MAQAKKSAGRAAKKPAAAKSKSTAEAVAAPQPARRRISRRKQVEEHVRSYFDALARRDSQAMAGHWSEDGVADIVPLGILRGRSEIAGLYRDLFAAVPDLQTTVVRVVAGEHEAAVEWRMDGHFTGEAFQGVEATGKWVEMRGIDLIEIAEGKNRSVASYHDGMSFARHPGTDRVIRGAVNAATKLRRTIRAGGAR